MKMTLQITLNQFEKKQAVVSALILLIMLGLSIVFNYVHLTSQAEQTSQLIARMMQIEDRREVEITLEQARLNYFKTIRFESADPRRTFTLPQISELVSSQSIFDKLTTEKFAVPVNNLGQNERIVFEFNRFSFIPHALIIWLLLNLVSIPQTRFMKKKIVEQYTKDMSVEKELAKMAVARKVRHNIRTPLSALMRLSSSARSLSFEESALFQSIITQIKGLISELDDVPPIESVTNEKSSLSFAEVVRNSIQEIRLALPSNIVFESDLEDSVHSGVVQFIPHELRSILGNLANNSAEAMLSGGLLKISIKDTGHEFQISVSDTGAGIGPEFLHLVTNKGFTRGKAKGSGLGLYHAKEFLVSWGGDLRIASSEGIGTTVDLYFPLQSRENWYVPEIKLSNSDTIVVIDDQIAIHRLWKMRLEDAGFQGRFMTFTNTEEAEFFLKTKSAEYIKLLVDYDLGEGFRTGAEFLRQVPSHWTRYLVTGHFDLKEIQEICLSLNVGLIPKSNLPALTILV